MYTQISSNFSASGVPMATQLAVQQYCDIVQSLNTFNAPAVMSNNPMLLLNMAQPALAGTVNFDGLQPDGAVTTSGNQFVFGPGAHQGLIDPVVLGIANPMRVLRFMLFMAGQATFSVNLVDGANSQVLASGTTATTFIQEKLTYLSPNQKLQVVTTGAATTSIKMVCTLCNPNFGTFGV